MHAAGPRLSSATTSIYATPNAYANRDCQKYEAVYVLLRGGIRAL